jgi:hypothetical protein
LSAGDWYIFDGASQRGPMPRAEVEQFLKQFAGRDEASVWYPGLQGWKPARQFFEVPGPAPGVVDEPPPDPHRHTNFIARYWRGEYSLGVSYWCFVILGNMAAGVVLVGLGAGFQAGAAYQPLEIFAYIAAIWLFSMTLVVWQTVGVWRSANRHRVRRHSIGKRAGWAVAAKIAVALGVLSSLGAFVRAGWPQLDEAARMAFLDDPSVPPYAIRVMRNGTEAEITGGFKYGLTDEFSKMLHASHAIRVVHLDSIGGRVGEAVKLNELLRSQGLDTYVSSGCYSACTIAFAAGRRRILRDGAVLGFHAPTFPAMSKDDMDTALLRQRRVFTEAGFDKSFIDKALATPNSDMWKPSVDTLTAAHVITGLSDGTDFAISGLGANLSKDRVAVMMTKNAPALRAMQSRYPKDFEHIIDAYYDGYVSGETESAETNQSRAGIVSVIEKLRASADDAVLVDIALLYADQFAALGAKDPAACYRYASGGTTSTSFGGDLPASLFARETELSRRIVETAKPRDPTPDAVVVDLWKKVSTQLTARGLGDDQFELLNSNAVNAGKYGEYCSLSVTFYREIALLPPTEAGILMRSMLTAK